VGIILGLVNATVTYNAGGSVSDVAVSFSAGFVTGFASIIVGAAGGAAAGGSVVVSGAGLIAGAAVDFGLTALLAPLTVPGSDLANGLNALLNCP